MGGLLYADYGEGSGLEIVHGEEVEERSLRLEQQQVENILKYYNSNKTFAR